MFQCLSYLQNFVFFFNQLSTTKVIDIKVHYAENSEFRFSRLRRHPKISLTIVL